MFERIVKIAPAFDHVAQGGGRHGVTMSFVLKGQKGAVQFVLFTNWFLPECQEVMDEAVMEKPDQVTISALLHPLPAGLRVHSPKPLSEGDQPERQILKRALDLLIPPCPGQARSRSCPYSGHPDGLCYSDESFTAGDAIFQALVAGGDDGLWGALEERYRLHLG